MHSFNVSLLNTYYVLCTDRGNEEIVNSHSSKTLAVVEVMVLWRRQTINKKPNLG